MSEIQRFTFIGHALRGDGPFRPKVTIDQSGDAIDVGVTYLIRYPRESEAKFARRNQVAFYSSPLHKACSRFVSHISGKAVQREIAGDLFTVMRDDIDGKGNDLDVFWQGFMIEAKARGSMLLLVDMPTEMSENRAEQIENRQAPYWTPIAPEKLQEYTLNESGKFASVSFHGMYYRPGHEPEKCVWTFTETNWKAEKAGDASTVFAEGDHNVGECPVLAFTESGDFPCFGAFAPIADLSKRLFNLESELDEILRAQTFSILTMQIPEGSTAEQMREAAKAAGETISTNNLMAHPGSTPQFIAPPDGPATVYMSRIKQIEERIDEIALQVATPNQRESGISMQMRFQVINAELARFSEAIEDLERRAWEISARWLDMDGAPEPSWPRDFNISDVTQELEVLSEMQASAMPDAVIRQQQKRVISTQYDALDDETKNTLLGVVDEQASAS